MRTLIYPTNDRENAQLLAWLNQRLPVDGPHQASCIGIASEAGLLAVLAYHDLKQTDVQMSMAAESPRWASITSARTLLIWPFLQYKVQRVSALTHKTNYRARRCLKGFGFVEEGKLRHGGINREALFLYGLTLDDFCKKYLKPGEWELIVKRNEQPVRPQEYARH